MIKLVSDINSKALVVADLIPMVKVVIAYFCGKSNLSYQDMQYGKMGFEMNVIYNGFDLF